MTTARWLARGTWIALRSLFAWAVACGMVVLVNQSGGLLAGLMGWSSGGDARLAWDLGWFTLAGMLATWALVRLAPRAPRLQALAWGVVLLAAGVYVVMQLDGDWPIWFSAGALLSLPLQVWMGARWAIGTRNARAILQRACGRSPQKHPGRE